MDKLMRVNFNKTVKTFKGADMIDQSTGEPLSMRDYVRGCLFLCPENYSADDKYAAWKILNKINADGEADITSEEASLIKRICAERSSAGIYGQVVDTIEGKEDAL